MANDIIIYALMGVLGIFVGYVMVFRGYGEKVKDILMDLKMRGNISDDEYDYFLRIYVSRRDKTKVLTSMLGRIKKKKEPESEEI